jgi:nicotinamidase-related amidase
MLISRERSLLLIVDIQEKLAPAIDQGAAAIINNQRLISAAQQLAVPVFVSEQYVKGLGSSVSAIKEDCGQRPFLRENSLLLHTPARCS